MSVSHLRASAFLARGVTLKSPDSLSGIRESDGVVVFAISADEVRADRRGYCSLLWAGGRRAASGTIERASNEERLEHCRIALRQGRGEGFLVHTGEAPYAGAPIALSIVLAGEKYWARWEATAMDAAAADARQAA